MHWLEHHWQRDTLISRLLLPLAWLYGAVVALNRYLYAAGWRPSHKLTVPVVVVGNITVGGTGKTPLVAAIVRQLVGQGWQPGIITRGYRGRAKSWPQLVTAYSDPLQVGDEPVLLASRSRVPVVADPNRVRGARWLLAHECDVIVSDDGLQHHRLRRDFEIAVVDGERRFGNGRCLPAGPLREPPARLARVDAVVVQGTADAGEWSMRLAPTVFRRVTDPEAGAPLDAFRGQKAHALAGIGYPPRFFRLLRELGVDVIEHPFPDHHTFQRRDIEFAEPYPIIMTEKDAVKCRQFAGEDAWYLAVEAQLDTGFGEWLQQQLRKA